ncbi:YicC/YloC family endoribonuclease [Oceanobacillus manasiensis]|uniref:YicC/YloC family endoribonuclease n=1 Tax=Oceanobacillus manasiensis TaxID=586413 RepID=UPI000A819F43|nr:YicC/YloC family endoribonuclease [Oceanobacillus manasiensis]
MEVNGCDCMLKSMTGYGSHVFEYMDGSIIVEIRSVNHRFLDLNVKVPRSSTKMEDDIRKIIQSFFQRGKIEVLVQIDDDQLNAREVHTNWDVLDQYISQMKIAQKRYDLGGKVSVESMALLPEIFTVSEPKLATQSFRIPLLEAIRIAAVQVKEMRETEGMFLEKDLRKRLELADEIIHMIGAHRPAVINAYKERIRKRVMEQLPALGELDQDRIHQEIVLLGEKGDVTEELTRLKSHINHFLETLKQQNAVGRKLDFIIQEMQREGNTIGAKSNDPVMSEHVVNLKSELEKMKEQVQNIE